MENKYLKPLVLSIIIVLLFFAVEKRSMITYSLDRLIYRCRGLQETSWSYQVTREAEDAFSTDGGGLYVNPASWADTEFTSFLKDYQEKAVAKPMITFQHMVSQGAPTIVKVSAWATTLDAARQELSAFKVAFDKDLAVQKAASEEKALRPFRDRLNVASSEEERKRVQEEIEEQKLKFEAFYRKYVWQHVDLVPPMGSTGPDPIATQSNAKERKLSHRIVTNGVDIAQSAARKIRESSENNHGIPQKLCEEIDISARLTQEEFLNEMQAIRNILEESLFSDAAFEERQRDDQVAGMLSRDLCLVRYQAEIIMTRGGYSRTLPQKESAVLQRLIELRNRADLNAATSKSIDSAIAEWKNYIDSSSGITYRFMRWQVESDERLVKTGMTTRLEMLRGVRAEVNDLIKLGHSPKWLREFE